MTRWFPKVVLVLMVGAGLSAACTGGQTGQPNIATSCPPRTVPADERVKGISPSELARAFEGRHTSALQWLRVGSGSPDSGSLPANDEITVGITYRGVDGETHCEVDLQVEVAVDITTRDTGVHEVGQATLLAPTSSMDLAGFAFRGTRVDAFVTLRRSGGVVEISGSLDSLAS